MSVKNYRSEIKLESHYGTYEATGGTDIINDPGYGYGFGSDISSLAWQYRNSTKDAIISSILKGSTVQIRTSAKDDSFDGSLVAQALTVEYPGLPLKRATATIVDSNVLYNAGAGNDKIWYRVEAYSDSTRDAASGLPSITNLINNKIRLLAEDGRDEINFTLTGSLQYSSIKDNLFELDGGSGDDSFKVLINNVGDLSSNSIVVEGGDGHDTAEFRYAGVANVIFAQTGMNSYHTENLGVSLSSIEKLSVTTGSGHDTLIGGAEADVLDGGTGGGRIMGGDGADTLSNAFGSGAVNQDLKMLGGSEADRIAVLLDERILNVTDILALEISDNNIVALGENGNDYISAYITAEGYGTGRRDSVIEGNILTLEGGAGEDHIYSSISASLKVIGYSSAVKENRVAISGGADNDDLSLNIGIKSSIVGSTEIINNTLRVSGDGGDDTIRIFSGVYSIAGNSIKDNNFTVLGGDGNDEVMLDGLILTNNNLRLFGGDGIDSVSLDYSYRRDTLRLDFSSTYNKPISGVTLDGFEKYHVIGGSGADVFKGGSGNNSFSGREGDDTYFVNSLNTSIFEYTDEGEDTAITGVDFILSSSVEILRAATSFIGLKLTGNTGDNTIIGSSGGDTLDSGGGKDKLYGGKGHDYYIINDNDTIYIERALEGIDTVQSSISISLTQNFENLTLTGSNDLTGKGNAYDNFIIGNSGSNKLFGKAGNDTLDGGAAGTDRLAGGVGNDRYIMDHAGVTVIEYANEGVDQVISTIDTVLGRNVEKLTLFGDFAIDGEGNALANIIEGNDSDNSIDGKGGADAMYGNGGNDSYVIDNIDDRIFEVDKGGTDRAISSVSYSLVKGQSVEQLYLTGSDALDATGNEIANIIVGNLGANSVKGLAGADRLTGGAGADTFFYATLSDSKTSASKRDVIEDFDRSEGDKINVKAIDGNATIGGNQAFYFLGSAELGPVVGAINYKHSGKNTIVSGDVDGDGRADMSILLKGVIALQQDDFIL